ncbi:MAG: hypothetical protein AAF492_19450, partial [Verrucomicrobiota bacterium]
MKRIGLSLLAVSVLLLALEGIAQLVVGAKRKAMPPGPTLLDPALGWVFNPDYPGRSGKNACGEPYRIEPFSHRLIVRPRASGGRPLLFLGDSYTEAGRVSTGSAYYDVFDAETEGAFSVFAVGHSAWGHAQERLALDEVFPELQPEIVVWQLTGNDVRDNVFEFDNNSFLRGQQKPRPYYDPRTGEMKLRNPGIVLFDRSILFRAGFKGLYKLDARRGWGLMRRIDRLNALSREERERLARQGLDVLDKLLAESVVRYPETRFYGFAVAGEFDADYERIFKQNGANYFPRFYEQVEAV